MKNQNLFDIVTLSECNDCLSDDPSNPLGEPITIIAASIPLLRSIFPNLLFGGRSAQQIAEDERRSMEFHKAAFLRKYGIQLSNDIVIAVLRPGWNAGENGAQLWDRIMNRFYNENRQALEDAKLGVGPLVTGQAPGGVFMPSTLSRYVPYIIGGIVLIMFLKKKK